MTYATLDDLSNHLEEIRGYDPDWYGKMMHKIPETQVVDRVSYLVNRCQGKRVLHLGCEGPLHMKLKPACAVLYGIDHVQKTEPNYYAVDLDWELEQLPEINELDLVLVPEVLEHLVNPGMLLRAIRTRYQCPIIVTCPNAFAHQPRLKHGWECVNADHKSWYSYWTIKSLLEACQYTVERFYWYHGLPYVAEGLIVEAN